MKSVHFLLTKVLKTNLICWVHTFLGFIFCIDQIISKHMMVALFGKLLSTLPYLVQTSLPLGSLSGFPQAQLHSLCCVHSMLHTPLLQSQHSQGARGWGLGRIIYNSFLLPPHFKGAFFYLKGTEMQMEKIRGLNYSGEKRDERK